MKSRKSVAKLEKEHVYIHKVVDSFPGLLKKIEAGSLPDPELLRSIVDFMRTYADKCHHGKEEAILFPYLVEHGVPGQGCPIHALLAEHIKGREWVKKIEESADSLAKDPAGTKKALIETLQALIALYQNHIWKEDYLLFPMTMKVLKAPELIVLEERFAKVDQELGRDFFKRYQKFARVMAKAK